MITAPTLGLTVVGAVVAGWTSITDPDAFMIDVDDVYTTAAGDYSGWESGTARSHSMLGIFDTSSGSSEFTLSALNQTTSLSGAAADSEFEVASSVISPTFNPD